MPAQHFVPASGWSLFLPLYDRLLATFLPERQLRAHMVEACQLAADQRLLDVGCGTGTLLGLLYRRYPQAELHGVDVDPRVMQLARRKLSRDVSGRIRWQIGSATELDYPDASFHWIVTSLVFHHLRPDEKRLAVREFRRLLVPGGVLVLADFAAPTNWLQRLFYIPVQVLDGWERTACNVAGRLPDLLQSAGFQLVEESFVSNSWLGTVRAYRASNSIRAELDS